MLACGPLKLVVGVLLFPVIAWGDGTPRSGGAKVVRSPSLSSQLGFSPRVINGVPISNRGTPFVRIARRESGGEFLCTGTLVTPRSVLTASHCVSRRPSQMSVFVSGRSRRVARVRIHPNARTDRSTGVIFSDLAILTLVESVNNPVLPVMTSREVQPGDVMTIYGYGLDEAGRIARLRQGVMEVAEANANFIFALFDGSGSNTCEGDSGGPAVVSYVDSLGETRTGLVAVTSGGEIEDCSPGDRSFFANMQGASHLTWLRQRAVGLSER